VGTAGSGHHSWWRTREGALTRVDVLVWSVMGAAVVALIVVDLVVFSRDGHEVSTREAAVWSGVWLVIGLGFALVVWGLEDAQHAGGYLAGYLIERSLSVDNVFLFALLLTFFAVPSSSRGRVLFLGVLGALVLRAGFIVGGAALLDAFHWVEYVFGAFLLVTAWRMFRGRAESPRVDRNPIVLGVRRLVPTTSDYRGGSLVVREHGHLRATPMVVVLVAVALVDVVFAVDSIPAIFAVTRDPFLVFASNAFAVLGMRALYFLLAGMLDRFGQLKVGLAAVLALVGVKMLIADLYEIPVWASLAAIVVILGASIAASLISPHHVPKGVTHGAIPRGAEVDRKELPADRGESRGGGPPGSGTGDDRHAGTRLGGDHPGSPRPGDRVRVGAPSPGEGEGSSETGRGAGPFAPATDEGERRSTMTTTRARKKNATRDRSPASSTSTPILTREGRALLEARVQRIRTDVMPELVLAMQDRERDGRHAHEYARVAVEHHRLLEALANARIAEDMPSDGADGDAVRLGDEVELRFTDGGVERCLMVHPVEAPLDDRRVSAESPLGKAMIGGRPGDEVEVRAPGRPYRCRLVRWDRKKSPRRLIVEVLSSVKGK